MSLSKRNQNIKKRTTSLLLTGLGQKKKTRNVNKSTCCRKAMKTGKCPCAQRPNETQAADLSDI